MHGQRRHLYEAHYWAGAGSLLLLFAAGPAFAHHPFASEFDAQALLTLSGAVTRMKHVHSIEERLIRCSQNPDKGRRKDQTGVSDPGEPR